MRPRQVLGDLAADSAQRLTATFGSAAPRRPRAGRPPRRCGHPAPSGVDRPQLDAELLREGAARAASPAPKKKTHGAATRLRGAGAAKTHRRFFSSPPITTSTVPTGTTSPAATRIRGDRTGGRRLNLDRRLVRLDLDERIVLGDLVALGDQPARDLALGQSLAEIGEPEGVGHAPQATAAAARPTSRRGRSIPGGRRLRARATPPAPFRRAPAPGHAARIRPASVRSAFQIPTACGSNSLSGSGTSASGSPGSNDESRTASPRKETPATATTKHPRIAPSAPVRRWPRREGGSRRPHARARATDGGDQLTSRADGSAHSLDRRHVGILDRTSTGRGVVPR